jgi:hypothetical protein
VSATLQEKLATLAQHILKTPAAVGLQLQYTEDKTLRLSEAADSNLGSFEMPLGLQQLFMDVPWKLRLPALIGPCTTHLTYYRTALT